MYRTAVVVVFLSTLALVAADLVLRLVLGRRQPEAGEPPAGSGPWGWLRMAVNVVGLVSLCLVASTAFSALLDADLTKREDARVVTTESFREAGRQPKRVARRPVPTIVSTKRRSEAATPIILKIGL